MFESVDLNNDGVITLEEFLHALEGAGIAIGHGLDRARVRVSEDDAAGIMAFFDRDRNGMLRYNEFMRLLQGTIQAPEAPMSGSEKLRMGSPLAVSHQDVGKSAGVLRKAIGLGSGSNEDIRQVQGIFEEWDVNGDGVISERELSQVLQRLQPSLTRQDVHQMFVAADVNRDGRVDYQEFLSWLFRGG